jgi:hypothetical protein
MLAHAIRAYLRVFLFLAFFGCPRGHLGAEGCGVGQALPTH